MHSNGTTRGDAIRIPIKSFSYNEKSAAILALKRIVLDQLKFAPIGRVGLH